MYLSKTTKNDPSMTSRLRKEFTGRLIGLYKQHAPEQKIKLTVNGYIRKGYAAGQIYGAGILRTYKAPFRPVIIDEDKLLNLIAQTDIALEDVHATDQNQCPDTTTIAQLTNPGFMGAFVQGIIDISRLSGVTNFQFLSAESCCNDCLELDGQIITIDLLESFAPPQHDSCLCVLIPLKGL